MHSSKEATWLRSPAPDISDDLKGPTTISDITAANALMRDHQYHTRTKPIDMRHASPLHPVDDRTSAAFCEGETFRCRSRTAGEMRGSFAILSPIYRFDHLWYHDHRTLIERSNRC